MQKKTLIIKCCAGDYEGFFNSRMVSDFVDVAPLLNEKIPMSLGFMEKLPGLPVYKYFWGSWRKHLKEYDTVIVFDSQANKSFMEKLCRETNGRVILWHWNIPGDNEPDYDGIPCEHWCFDMGSCKERGWSFNDQFFFDIASLDTKPPVKRDLLFTGFDKGRADKLREIADTLCKDGVTFEFNILATNKEFEPNSGFNKLTGFMPYKDVLNKTFESKCVLELLQPGQTGLTTRCLEALFLGKKLLTNNKAVKERDFYRKENIFILDEDDPKNFAGFLNTPTVPIDDGIKQYYTFNGWIERICKTSF